MHQNDIQSINRTCLAAFLFVIAFTLFLTRGNAQCSTGVVITQTGPATVKTATSAFSDRPIYQFSTETVIQDSVSEEKTDWRISLVQVKAVSKIQKEAWSVISIEAGLDGTVIVNMEGGDKLVLSEAVGRMRVELTSTIVPRKRTFF